MDDATTPTKLAASTGISISYASQILSGRRPPSRALAVTIFQKIGLKLGPIAEATDEDIAALARLEGLAERAA